MIIFKKGFHIKIEGKTALISEKQGNLHLFHFKDKEDQTEKISSTTLELKPYSVSPIPKKQSYSAEKPLSQFIGLTGSVMVRCSDIVEAVYSLPCKILSIIAENSELTIIGTNDLYIHTTGFKGVRESETLLFDIFTKSQGYNHTIHLTI